ncbi:hypothetical protein [Bosea sp. RAC05]|uniref:hypothetical protein n=1 Tax=Bosea sp. RAC05 TaxID=1842539 RepID=UPI00083DDF2D|nr:hypothetical protein [Bosea sp. RAC05]AOG03409.1 hypothetical protein BSY19_5254 [Bosea sp. RAC05]
MSTHSTDGREWARIDQTVKGSQLSADGDFSCIRDGATLVVDEDEDGLFVLCRHGRHHLHGQANDDETHFLGFWPKAG